MRIVCAWNHGLKECGKRYFNIDSKFQQGLIGNGHYVYSFSLNDIERLFSPICHRTFGKKGLNKALLKTCMNIGPDILFLVHANRITPETLAAIRQAMPDIAIIFFWGDAIWENAANIDRIREKLPYLDSVFITTGGDWLIPYAGPGRVVAYVPNPTEAAIDRGRAFEAEQTDYDLIFFGSDDPDRNPLLSAIEKALPDLKTGFFGCLGNPSVFGVEKERITSRSKMALNLTRRNDVFLCSSNRLADTTANGVLTFCDQASGLQALYRENEVVYYRDRDDLIAKIRHYHENDQERIAIARAGWQRAHEAFSAQRVTRFMLDATLRSKGYTDIPWPRFILEDGRKVQWDEHLIMCPSG
uniref:Glycosyl transferases group 1 n=1 Tax=Candidatus Kentrum sp. MB TaxID=2138164 RepID=A0A450XZ20_9GAMM|nr:MAG: Glycosyl transferases group 1 [Candidatus Kentron sp. MB]VFK34493.1 MAG: Glycosyl transferases group 1 [Candidatus Kentron sp. MB]VFK76786.1 MAG: Glycosyl transferases group 1 [Candidatus Kentron sp. MB]